MEDHRITLNTYYTTHIWKQLDEVSSKHETMMKKEQFLVENVKQLHDQITKGGISHQLTTPCAETTIIIRTNKATSPNPLLYMCHYCKY